MIQSRRSSLTRWRTNDGHGSESEDRCCHRRHHAGLESGAQPGTGGARPRLGATGLFAAQMAARWRRLTGRSDRRRRVADPHCDAYEIRRPDTPRRTGTSADASLGPEDPRFHHSYASWLRCAYTTAKGLEKEKPAWRVAEFLGVNRSISPGTSANWARVVNDSPAASLVVLDDADLGFRSQRELWPPSLTAPGSRPWVLVKMSTRKSVGPPVGRPLLSTHRRHDGERSAPHGSADQP